MAAIEPSTSRDKQATITDYKVLMSKETVSKVIAYFEKLKKNPRSASNRLTKVLKQHETDLNKLSLEQFIECLVQTKTSPTSNEQTAEDEKDQNKNWCPDELSILSDISFSVPGVTFYADRPLEKDDDNSNSLQNPLDNGPKNKYGTPKVHKQPFKGILLFTSGALLKPGEPDRKKILDNNNKFDGDAYYKLYERRLFPLLKQANDGAAARNKKVFITLPKKSFNVFFEEHHKANDYFEAALQYILSKHAKALNNIQAVYFDHGKAKPKYRGIQYNRGVTQCKHIFFLTQSLFYKDNMPAQFCPPKAYENLEYGYLTTTQKLATTKFSDCEFASIVAMEPLLSPQSTATNVTTCLTGLPGAYNKTQQQYQLNSNEKTETPLQVKDRIKVLDIKNNQFVTLDAVKQEHIELAKQMELEKQKAEKGKEKQESQSSTQHPGNMPTTTTTLIEPVLVNHNNNRTNMNSDPTKQANPYQAILESDAFKKLQNRAAHLKTINSCEKKEIKKSLKMKKNLFNFFKNATKINAKIQGIKNLETAFKTGKQDTISTAITNNKQAITANTGTGLYRLFHFNNKSTSQKHLTEIIEKSHAIIQP